jgi:hypothetical protein
MEKMDEKAVILHNVFLWEGFIPYCMYGHIDMVANLGKGFFFINVGGGI